MDKIKKKNLKKEKEMDKIEQLEKKKMDEIEQIEKKNNKKIGRN